MVSSRKLFTLLAIAAMLASAPDASARLFGKKKQAVSEAPKEEAAPKKKKSKFEKFLEKKGLETVRGFVTLYKDGNDLYLEIPDSLIGSQVIFSTVLQSASDPSMSCGIDCSKNPIYRIELVDSMVIFRLPQTEYQIAGADSSMTRALEKSNLEALKCAYDIKYKTDSSYVFKANGFFSLNRNEVFSLVGKKYGDYIIQSADIKNDKSYQAGVSVYGNSVAVENNTTLSLSLASSLGFELSAKPGLTVNTITTLSPVRESDFTTRKVDTRVGVRKKQVPSISSTGEIKGIDMACRWNLEGNKVITIYVDTLLAPSWQDAVIEGLEAWNVAFEEAGIGKKIVAEPYPADFCSADPYASVVSLVGGGASSVSARTLVSNQGEIMSARVMIPGDYLLSVRRRSVYSISAVDERYRRYALDDDAVCEVLKADVMKIFAYCLGLENNLAGSYAYTPNQLRCPSWTRKHGIVASVTDDVLFNTLARPGDKERGVVTIIDRVGSYDRYAIKWLYADGQVDDSQLFIPASSSNVDPRGIKYDLGTDILASMDSRIATLHFVADHAYEWLTSEQLPQSYSELFIDWIFLNYMYTNYYALTYVGGVYASDVRDGSVKPKMEAVPDSLQRTVARVVLANLDDLSWLDNKDLLQLAGANVSVNGYMRTNYVSTINPLGILDNVAMTSEEFGCQYGPDEFLSDYEELVFGNLRQGRMIAGDDNRMTQYIYRLISTSPVLLQNFKKMDHPSKAFADDFTISAFAVPGIYTWDLDMICYRRLKSLEAEIESLIPQFEGKEEVIKLNYMVNMIKTALYGNN